MKWVLLITMIQFSEVRSYGSNTGSCDTIRDDVRFGPSELLLNLTHPSIYDSQKRPNSAYIPGKQVIDKPDDVYIALYLNSIMQFNELEQTMTTSLVEEVLWTDERLLWDINTEAQCVPIVGFDTVEHAIPLEPRQFEGKDKLIWTPSTDIINVVTREYGKSFAISHPDATTHRFEQQEITTTCPMRFGKYPFDKHTCYFDVSSFQHSDKDIALHPGVGFPVITNETNLLDVSNLKTDRIGQFLISKHTSTVSYQGSYYTLRGQLEFERHGEIFAVDILLPDMLLHISIYASFWLPSYSPPARVALCIISALSFRIMRTSISEKLPPVSYAIWVVDYMAASQAIAVLALIQFAIVCYFVSFEHIHDKVFEQFKESKIPRLIKRHPNKAMILFKEAKLQYEEFILQAYSASETKADPTNIKRKSLKSILTSFTTPRIHASSQQASLDEQNADQNLEEQNGVIISTSRTDESDLDIQSEHSIDMAMSSFTIGDHDEEELDEFPSLLEMMAGPSPTTSPKASSVTVEKSKPVKKRASNISRDSTAFDQLNFNLTIPEVMVIAHVRAAFKQYDEDHNGVLRISELQKCLRHFGKYFSTNQVCSIVAAYRQSQGSNLGLHPTVNLADFFCILVEMKEHEPLDEFVKSDWYGIPPSHVVDLFGRLAYPSIVLAKIMIFFMILNNYD